MGKILILILISLAMAVGAALIATYVWRTPSAEPKLKIEFNPTPPWHIKPSENLELNITIKNEGSSLANNVSLTLTAPTGFTVSQSGTNIYTKNFAKLEVGEKQIESLNMTVSTAIKPGNYTITIIILADNVPKKSYNHQITVELPYIP